MADEARTVAGVGKRAASASLNISLDVGAAATNLLSTLRRKQVRQQPRNIYQRPVVHKKRRVDQNDETSMTLDDFETICTALKSNVFVGERSEEERTCLAGDFEHCSYRKDERIIFQGEPGDYFFILKSGTVRFAVDGLTVGRSSTKGESFGELALLYTSPRAATVVAETEVEVFRVDHHSFQTTLKAQAEASVQEKFQLLEGVPFLESLSRVDRKRLAGAMTPRLFEAGQKLLQKGVPGHEFWILRDGEVKVINISVGSCKYEDVVLKKGDYFGERALATDEPRAADVVSMTSGVAFTIDRTTFDRVLGSISSLIIKAQDSRKLFGIDLFRSSSLDALQYERLASLFTRVSFKKGYMIAKIGFDTPPALYFVREGKVQVTYPNEEQHNVSAGGYFGEQILRIPDTNADGKVRSPVMIEVVEDCTCGMLTIRDCRTVFDTDVAFGSLSLDDVATDKASMFIPNDPSGFQKHAILGQGTFGQVWLVTSLADSAQVESKYPYALKIQSKRELIREGQVKAALREREVMDGIDHPFLLRLFKTYQDEAFLYCVFDFVQGGELFSLMHPENEEQRIIPEGQARFYVFGVADALSFLHQRKIVHRDIKPENVLLDCKGFPVLIDLGFAEVVENKTFTICGTPGYVAHLELFSDIVVYPPSPSPSFLGTWRQKLFSLGVTTAQPTIGLLAF